MKKRILIVDDEIDICRLINITLNDMNLDPFTAYNVAQAKAALKNNFFSLCITDLRLPDYDGIHLLEHINKNFKNLPVIIISGHGTIEIAINSLKKGAFDFITKPIQLKSFKALINNALQLTDNKKNKTPKSKPNKLLSGNSKIINNLTSQISKVAKTQAPVHIYGPSGSGKELVARLIHNNSHRNPYPFIAINCGAIPEDLIETELFGHKKGSFTGAINNKDGLFQAANKGTLFLDEVNELSTNMQVKLLRAIQEKSIKPIGCNEEIPVDIRILSASNKDIQDLVKNHLFREDLFYRINVIQINTPSLQERKEDIPLLADEILTNLSKTYNIKKPVMSQEFLNELIKHPFPGNVRELENILERAITLSDMDILNLSDLSLPSLTRNKPNTKEILDTNTTDLTSMISKMEKTAITTALINNDNNKSATAKELGISLRILRYKLKNLNI